ncbi:aminotransferase class III-fold pyridoxal phosphate-dependent enzyme [Segeticoccus rhizosphaerae]|jgi:4-aminobutyrate aminotransferase-like enzyme|uniref:aminotransferase class III-fold pyridoxal phosphate-dependent enzyme n=1 Tax=Segeticoccus rhizosphaerae TaxID=1104777 RepID=UPI0010BFF8F9|nr:MULTISPECIES: aminotransferase class III-fold pyridoxal phosphate-dependent enzyme [Intrasporangiaceae]
MANAFDPDRSGAVNPRDAALLGRRRQHLGAAYRLFYREPVHLVRGEGVRLFDPDGNAYLDAYNNVACVGHSHPHVVRAMTEQAQTLNTHTRYLTDGIVEYAERLLALFPPTLSQLTLTCTGSEANDLAYRMACTVTGGTGVVVTDHAYHGVTTAIAQMSPSLGLGVADHVRTVPPPDPHERRGPAGAVLAADVRASVADLVAQGIQPAMLLLDTIFSSDGVLPDPRSALQEAVGEFRRAGGLFVADEVQAGFARLGPAMWGFERHGLTAELAPDLVTLGKPMGNGYPMAGVVSRADIAAEFGARTRYFNTFGGNPVACAVGSAVLDVIEQEHLREHVADVGKHLAAGLRDLSSGQEALGDVRADGLFVGVDLQRDGEPAPDLADAVVNGLRDRRVLVSTSGPHEDVLKIRPPLVFQRSDADQLLEALEDTLGEVAGAERRES